MARRKSRNDLAVQMGRIDLGYARRSNLSDTDIARWRRAQAAYERYGFNIWRAEGGANAQERPAFTQYPRSVYMGLNNG